jgi:hypothetical protein
MRPSKYIIERQHSWALRHGVPLDEFGCVVSLSNNLFLPLTSESIREFQAGAGNELNSSMRAPHSSSALVVNVFHYWRLYQNLEPIISALNPGLANYEVQDIRFEVLCPINWPVPRGKPPHLDVVIRYRDQAEPEVIKAIAVESKFQETYGQDQGTFADSYMDPENSVIWTGLEPLRQMASQIHAGVVLFRHLKVSQLIKHILGLNAQFGGPNNYVLAYLWYPVAGPEADQHEQEVGRFRQVVESCQPRIKFRAIAYQDLIYTLAQERGDSDGTYIDYLLERYF